MKNVAIIGGGLVGSLLSIYLAQKGHKVEVFERRPDMRNSTEEGGRSINLALSNRGWAALEEVGIADTIRAISIPMYHRCIHNEDGSIVNQAYGQEGEAIFSVSRAQLNRELDKMSDQHSNVAYHYSSKCTDVDLKNTCFSFKNELNGENFTINPDYCFGADGAFSTVRLAMQMRKGFNYEQSYLPHGYKELSIPAGENGTWLLEKNALHIWPRRTFMLIALPNLDGSFTCTLFLSFEGKDAFENLTDDEAILAFFKEEFADAVPLMPTLLEDFKNNPTDHLVTVKCAPWVNNKTLILGDASHAIVPFYGQGMNSGFEDCRVFNQLLEDMGEDGDWSKVFEKYSDLRKPDADAIAEFALRNFVEMRDDVADASFLLRKKIEKYLQKKYPNQFIPTYSLVTFSPHIRYSEAMRRSNIQNEMFEKLMQIPNLQELFENGEADDLLKKFIEEYGVELKKNKQS